MTDTPVPFTHDLAQAVRSIDIASLRPDVVDRARHCLLDWLGCTMAGSREETAGIARKIMATEAPGAGVATVIGSPMRLGPQGAAFVNGVSSHALDFDDSSIWAAAHASGPMVAALLAVAEQREASGSQVLEAIVAGLQGQCMLGIATGGGPYEKGFHTTGTMGVFGATMAVSRLIGLGQDDLQRALSLAATQSSGLKAVFGTMGKHLNTAKAASGGVLASLLAESGFTAPLDTIEARLGFEWTQSTTFDPAQPAHVMGETYGVESVFFKRYACCHDTHSAVEGIFAIRARRPFDIGEVKRVELGVPVGLMDICAIPEPVTGLQGKFSVRYACARALADVSLGVEGFSDEEVRRPDLIALRDLVDVIVTNDGDATKPTEVTIHFHDGKQESVTIDPLVPVSRDQLSQQWDELSEKFLTLASAVVGEGRAKELHAAVEQFESVDDLSGLLELTSADEH